jgi:hypothetical protein
MGRPAAVIVTVALLALLGCGGEPHDWRAVVDKSIVQARGVQRWVLCSSSYWQGS